MRRLLTADPIITLEAWGDRERCRRITEREDDIIYFYSYESTVCLVGDGMGSSLISRMGLSHLIFGWMDEVIPVFV
jgi:hypothetical protein